MNPIITYANFSSLVEERSWPIEPEHAIKTTRKLQEILVSHFIIHDRDLVKFPQFVSRIGYKAEDCLESNLGRYSFISTAKNKCWVVFQKVIIGEGHQTKARLALELFSGEIDVLTEYRLSDNLKLKRFESQVECLSEIRGKPYILPLKDYYFARSTTGHLFAGMFAKYCPNGDLLDYVNEKGSSPQFIPSLIQGVRNIHEAGLIHRDLKSENVFLDENNEVCIGDFGFACIDGTDQERMGSAPYMAPEIRTLHNPISQKIDIWSLGVLLYTLIFKKLPPHSASLAQRSKELTNEDYQEAYKNFNQFYKSLSESPFHLFIRQFFEIDPDKRLTIDEIKLPEFFLTANLTPLSLSVPNPNSLIIPGNLMEVIKKIMQELRLGELYDISTLSQESDQLKLSEEELKPFQDVMLFPQNLYSIWIIFQKAILHTQTNRITYLACEIFKNKFSDYAESTLTNEWEEKQSTWEIHCLEALKGHPNIQKIYGHFLMEAEDLKVSGLFTERLHGETLQVRLNSNKTILVKWFNEIINAVKVIHGCGFVHRNLQLGTLHIRPNDPHEEIVIGDFSNACPIDENPQERVGSLFYIAPELLASPPINSQAQDIWSLGIIFYCLMYKKYPPFIEPFYQGFEQSAIPAVLNEMRAFCNEPVSFNPDISFLQQFFVMDPQKRPTIGKVKQFPRGIKRQ